MKKYCLLPLVAICFACLCLGQADNGAIPAKPVKFEVPDYIKSRKAYKRAEWFGLPRMLPYDTFPAYTYAREMTNAIEKAKASRANRDVYLCWNSVGPKGFQTPYENSDIVSGRVRAVAVHPTDPQTVYIGAASGGLWKTTDGGQSWQDIGHDLSSMMFGAIAIDPNYPETVYAGSGESILLNGFYEAPGTGLFKSTDGGQNWTVITDGFGGMTHFSDLAVSPYNSNIVIATICHGSVYSGIFFPNEGIWRSEDAGTTWTKHLDIPCPFDVAFHPTDPDMVYAAVGGLFSPLAGFFISNDQGLTWTPSNTGLWLPELGGRIQFDISQSDPSIIYAVIYQFDWDFGLQTKAFKSTDSGANWAQISTGSPLGGNYNGWYDQGWYDLCIAVDPDDPDHVLIGNVELHRTTNGALFQAVRPFGYDVNGTLVHCDYHQLVYAPSDPNVLYIGCDGGIYKSPDKGYTAISLNQGLETLQFYRITVHPENPEIIIGGMQDNGTARTQDGGQSWHHINGADGMECFYNRSNPDILFSAIQYGDFYKSANGGNSFMYMGYLNGGWTMPVFMHPTQPNTLIGGTRSIIKSTNGGGSWSPVAENVTVQFISSLAQSQVNPNNMILGTGQEHPIDSLFLVKISTDEGVTWTDVTGSIPGESRWIAKVVTDPVDENTMYVLRTGFSTGNKVYQTSDLGQTWTNISGDLPDLPTNDLFIDPDSTGHLFLATDIGIYVSINGGENWVFASDGIPFVPCIDFHYEKIDDVPYLWIGTYGRSIYMTRLDIGVGIDEPEVQSAKCKVQSYPNPTNGLTEFLISNFNSQHVSLRVYNAQGQEAAVVFDGELAAGEHTVQWDASALPAGIYYYSLTTDDLPAGRQGRRLTTGKLVKL